MVNQSMHTLHPASQVPFINQSPGQCTAFGQPPPFVPIASPSSAATSPVQPASQQRPRVETSFLGNIRVWQCFTLQRMRKENCMSSKQESTSYHHHQMTLSLFFNTRSMLSTKILTLDTTSNQEMCAMYNITIFGRHACIASHFAHFQAIIIQGEDTVYLS